MQGARSLALGERAGRPAGLALLAASAAWLLAACSEGGAALSAEARAGRSVYRASCTACHGIDPAEPGGVGPALAGSSLELLRAKVLRGEYPPGYAPQRDTQIMPRFPHLEDELPALAAYLRAAQEGSETEVAAPSTEGAAE